MYSAMDILYTQPFDNNRQQQHLHLSVPDRSIEQRLAANINNKKMYQENVKNRKQESDEANKTHESREAANVQSPTMAYILTKRM